MIKTESENSTKNVCDLKYLSEIMGEKKHLIKEIMDVFLEQIPDELQSIDEAIINADFVGIKKIAHTMKSSVSIMGIASLVPILQEIENLGTATSNLEKIKELNLKLNLICKKAIEEIEKEKCKYV